ncbi:MAG: signal peptide peptidase SppA [Flavobacteriaceae bacterium]|nr:signal peptide peptidase SppA [Flavobacteriaceae bacterium]
MNFLKNILSTILGVFIAFGILFFLLILLASAIETEEVVTVKSQSVLKLSFDDRIIKDYAPKDESAIGMLLEMESPYLGFDQVLNAIENAKADNNIDGISIEMTMVNAGMAQTQALRKKLMEFKETGKFISSYADFYEQKNYYLSSVADSIFINPLGLVDFRGLSTEVLYYKDFEDKYGVKMEVVRHGKYKSGAEPFLFNKMSDENREQIKSFLTSMWDEMVSEIAVNRNKTTLELNNLADNLGGRNADLAEKNGLVDQVAYQDEYISFLKRRVGITEDKTLNTISLIDYIKSGKGRKTSAATSKIAIIYAQGEMIYGKGNEEYVGQEMMIKSIQKAKKDKEVKAIVLRINSPGGVAITADMIWRELELAKKEKPIVVSMGNLAASGGYYIACNANKIFAEPTTITGSIGVYGLIPNIHKFSETIGINAEQVSTNKAPNYSLFEPMSEDFNQVTQQSIEIIYNTFLNRVSAGRNMSVEKVDEIAQGRVWSGKEALKNGLVDELGSMEDAIKYAALIANISDYKTVNYPQFKKEWKDAFDMVPFIKSSKTKLLKEELGEAQYQLYEAMQKVSKHEGVQARMPFVLEIK